MQAGPDEPTAYAIRRIGRISASDEAQAYSLEIDEPYRDALTELERFSHVHVLWWADRADTGELRATLVTDLPYAPGTEAGVFASRSQQRPNPVGMTTTMVLDVDTERGVVVVPWIDALDGSPVIDLKPYIPCVDRVRDVRVADWCSDWPEWMEEAGEYFARHDVDFGD